MRDRYYSKVILFGEYSMIFDATALMIPLKRFSAQWQLPLSFNRAASLPSNQSLKRFCQYLSENEALSSLFDLHALKKDLDEGLFLRGLWWQPFMTAMPFKKPKTIFN